MPCIVQDWRTGEVLTLAYMNAEALRRTRETGEIHFFSRSRQELWHKGATSGNTQAVKAIRYDCDADAVLALVEPAGPACHTGERSCFHRGDLDPGAPFRDTADARAHDRRAGSDASRKAPTPSKLLDDREPRRRQGAGGGRGGGPRRARGVATSAWPRRPPTSSTTSRCCSAAGDCRWPTRSRCSMAVASPDTTAAGVRPSLAEARALAGDYNVIPVRETFIDDCQTPGLSVPQAARERAGVPARVGRPGTSGALLVHRHPAAQGAALVARRSGRPIRPRRRGAGIAQARAAARPAAVRGRRRGAVRLRPGADGRAAGAAQPRPDRAARPGADADRRAGRLRPPQAHGDGDRQRLRRRRAGGVLPAGARDDRRGPLAAGRPGAAVRRSPRARSAPHTRCSPT